MKSRSFLEELKNKSLEQLKVELTTAKKELFDLRLKSTTNQLEDSSKIRKVRKNIARIETIITIKKKEA